MANMQAVDFTTGAALVLRPRLRDNRQPASAQSIQLRAASPRFHNILKPSNRLSELCCATPIRRRTFLWLRNCMDSTSQFRTQLGRVTMTWPKSASSSAFAAALPLGTRIPPLTPASAPKCGFDAYLSRPHGPTFEGPAQRSLTLRPACSPSRLSDPLHQRLRRLRFLCRRSDCYRVERTSSRAGLSPAED